MYIIPIKILTFDITGKRFTLIAKTGLNFESFHLDGISIHLEGIPRWYSSHYWFFTIIPKLSTYAASSFCWMRGFNVTLKTCCSYTLLRCPDSNSLSVVIPDFSAYTSAP